MAVERPTERSVYLGPRLKRLRRELGLTQAQVAADLDISSSYVALLERNQRPMTADLLLRLARSYKLDLSDLAEDASADNRARLIAALRDPMFADIDLPSLELADAAANFPGVTEAFLRLHSAWTERQNDLADRSAASGVADDPVADVQRFLAARRNCFPALDEAAEGLAARIEDSGGLEAYIASHYPLRVRRIPSDVMMGSLRRYDRHREELLIDDSLGEPSHRFQLALQLAYIELRHQIDSALTASDAPAGDVARTIARRSLGSYAAAAIRLPYAVFARAAETRHYDLELLARLFGASFEQIAHRLTTLQKPGAEKLPFFFIRVDAAGNVSKRLDGAGFPFARHGGGCPRWNLHDCFATPERIRTQWLELPDGKRFFSVARTVSSPAGGYGSQQPLRAIALGCAAEEAHRLVYAHSAQNEPAMTIGITCRLCQRMDCTARSAPPLGRQLLADDNHRGPAPFGFADG